MKTRDGSAPMGCAIALAATLASTAFADYGPGSTWHRGTDWVAGSAHGGQINNPGPDSEGSGCWYYEWSRGDGFDSEDPWFMQSRSLMTWDSEWWGNGWGVWSQGDDASPHAERYRLIHNVFRDTYEDMPIIRWRNPVDGGGVFDITGSLLVVWDGPGGLGSPSDIDVVVALVDGTARITPLVATTVSKPTNEDSLLESASIPVDIRGLSMESGESILVSLRSHEWHFPSGRWNNLYDNVRITMVPAPGAVGLLALGAIAAGRRRR